jgi:predicted phage baseplate assembly protein
MREVLGSGNGTAFQTFALKKSPLTYLPATDPEGLSAVESTLILSVNNVLWTEVPSLTESAPDDQVYTLAQDDTGVTTVTFGDGFNGARPPTAKDSIVARYRKGLGTSGNVAAGGVQQLIDSTPGLQKVTNPTPTGGGDDAEDISQIRQNAPGSLRVFSRAVSVADYAALALTYPGIVKASAAYVTRDAELRAIPNPYIQLTVATADRTPLAAQPVLTAGLRSFLDARRDPNVPLRIIDFTPVYIDVTATIDIEDRSPRQGTLAEARAAMPEYFSFERLQFGESIHLSGIYAALEAVPGVRDAVVTVFRRLSPNASDPNVVLDHVFIGPTEIAVIANDPQDAAQGTLTINLGEGGFEDA